MTFGDWELFKVLILSLREQQLMYAEEEAKNPKSYQSQQTNSAQERKGK